MSTAADVRYGRLILGGIGVGAVVFGLGSRVAMRFVGILASPEHLGNPTELSLLEMAQTVIQVTSSKSEIVFEALPVDDPQVRQPDITRARQVLGWEPEIAIEEGLRRMLPSNEREAESIHV